MTSEGSVQHRTFARQLGAVQISIVLRTDIKQELKDCREVLQAIIQEIEEEISNVKVK